MSFEEKDVFISPVVQKIVSSHEKEILDLSRSPRTFLPYQHIITRKSSVLADYRDRISALEQSFVSAFAEREGERRESSKRIMKDLRESLLVEKKLSRKNIASVDMRWKIIERAGTLDEVKSLVSDQKKRIEEVLLHKKNQVGKLKEIIVDKDRKLQEQLNEQDMEMIQYNDSIKKEIESLKKKYEDVLEEIERSYYQKRNKILEGQMEQYEKLIQEKNKIEKMLIKEQLKTTEDDEEKIDLTHDMNRDELLVTKKKLDEKIQSFQLQLANFNGLFHLNTSRMKYYIDILETELIENNAIAKGNKLKIQRLQDQLVKVKGKYKIDLKNAKEENRNLSKSYSRNIQQFKLLMKKFRKFEKNDNILFDDLIAESEKRLRKLKQSVEMGERVVYRDVLKIPETTRQKLEEMKKKKEKESQSIIASITEGIEENEEVKNQVVDTPKLLYLKKKVLKKILNALSFIVPKKQLTKKDEVFQLDALFTLLHRGNVGYGTDGFKIDSIKEVNDFVMYFISSSLDIKKIDIKDDLETDFYLNDLIIPENLIQNVKDYVKKKREDSKRIKKNTSGIIANAKRKNENKNGPKSFLYPDKDEFKMWKYLKKQLENYTNILQKRRNLSYENKRFKKQNKELKLLLENYERERFSQIYYSSKSNTKKNYNDENIFL